MTGARAVFVATGLGIATFISNLFVLVCLFGVYCLASESVLGLITAGFAVGFLVMIFYFRDEIEAFREAVK